MRSIPFGPKQATAKGLPNLIPQEISTFTCQASGTGLTSKLIGHMSY